MKIEDIKGFLTAHLKAWQARLNLLPVWQKEQVEWRATQCPECVSAGRCRHCGCSMPERLFDWRGCSAGKYPSMMSQETWEVFKKIDSCQTKD